MGRWGVIYFIALTVSHHVIDGKLSLDNSPKSSEMLSIGMPYGGSNGDIYNDLYAQPLATDDGNDSENNQYDSEAGLERISQMEDERRVLLKGEDPKLTAITAKQHSITSPSTTTKTVETKIKHSSLANIKGIDDEIPSPPSIKNTNNINAKSYRPTAGILNPFEQLAALDHNFLFNAERHTVFQLHTSIKEMSVPAATNITLGPPVTGSVLNVVSGTIGAAFGVNVASAAVGAPSVRVEQIQLYNGSSLRQSRFNPFNPTRILIHGWFGGSHAGIYNILVPEFLKLGSGNYNVFTVDWGRGAIADYITASYRVKPVGRVVAKFIDFLNREAGIRFEDLHVIGFSMGAHIAGIAGKHITTGRLPVIYALDPALPLFRYDNFDERVGITDADYVEVLHTSAGSYGYDRPIGHVDFYANYGSGQPGCFFNECSHFRAFQLFAESLRSTVGFRGIGCDVKLWQEMTRNRRCPMGTGLNLTMGGDPEDVTALKGRGGVYYFSTNANPPYAKKATIDDVSAERSKRQQTRKKVARCKKTRIKTKATTAAIAKEAVMSDRG